MKARDQTISHHIKKVSYLQNDLKINSFKCLQNKIMRVEAAGLYESRPLPVAKLIQLTHS